MSPPGQKSPGPQPGRGLYIRGKRDTRFDGKCSVCGQLTLDATGEDHRHLGEGGSMFDSNGVAHDLPPPMPFKPDEFACPYCLGRVDFNTGAHEEPRCATFKGVLKAVDAWADRLNDQVVARRQSSLAKRPKEK